MVAPIRRGVFTLIFFALNCLPLAAQSPSTYDVRFEQTPLPEALRNLEQQYGLSFSFDDDAVTGIFLNVHFRNLPLGEAMQRLFAGTGLDFEILDGRYILIKKGTENQPPSPTPPLPPELTLCGKVFDAESGEALPGAVAYVPGTSHGTTTDENGSFLLKGLFEKGDTLLISFLGYERIAVPANGLFGQPCAEYRLSFAATQMPGVVIRDFAVDMVSLGEQGDFSFKKEKIPTLPGWGEPDVLRMLQLMPGIGSADETASNLNVRGGTPDQNLVLWEGIPIYHTGHFFGLYDAFNPFVVQSVDVWRGNFGAEYGGRNSSVIDIKGKPDYASEARWSAGLNLLSINAWWEKPLKKDRMSLLVAFRRSYTDLIQSSTYQNLFNQIFQNGRVALQEQYQEKSEFVTWNPAFRYGDFNMKLRWKGKRGSENAVSLYFGSDQLDYRFAFDDGTNFAATGDHISARNGGLSWQHQAQWSDEFRVDYKVALSAYQNDYRFQWNDEPERPFVYRWNTENKMTDISALFHHVWQVSERHQMSFGYQLTLQEASLVYRDTNAVLLHGNIQVNDTARSDLHTFYGEFSYQPSDKFAFTLGVRENHFPSRGLYYSEPRINFTWRPFGDHFKVKGGMGRYWQFVFQIIDFGDLGVGEPLWALASEQIPAQVLWQWSLGASYQTHSLLIDGEFYLKNNRNLTSLNLQVDRGFDRPWVFDGQSSARGFDFLLRKRWHPYSLWLAYSSGSVTLQFPELNDGLPYPARHDIRQSLNLVNMWAFKRWDFSANLHLRSGSPYSIPGVTQVPCPNCQADSLTYALDFNRLNGERLPGTFRIDLGASYHFETSKTKGKIGLAIYNLLNRRNLLDKDFLLETPPTNEPQTTYQLQALNRLAAGVTPNLFVQFEW